MADLLICVRAVHFAATTLLAGVVFFIVFVGKPAWRSVGNDRVVVVIIRRLAAIAWIGFILVLLSGAAWLTLTAADMSGLSVTQVFGGDVLWTVLSQTTFGQAWLVRFVLGCVVAATLPAGLGIDPSSPGHATALFVDWQFTGENDELLDPARYQ